MSTELRVPDVELRAPRRWPPFAFAGYSLLGVAAILLAMGQHLDPGPFLPFFLQSDALLGIGLLAFSQTRYHLVRRRGQIRIDDARISFRGRNVLERRALLQAVAFHEDGRHVVRLTSRRSRVIDLTVRSAEDGERILVALGRSAAQTTTTFPAIPGGMGFRVAVGLALLAGTLGSLALAVATASAPLSLNPFLVFLVGYLAMIAVHAASTRSRVIVGADGLSIRRPLRPERFVAFRELTSVQRRGREMIYQVEGETKPRRLTLVDRHRRGGTQAQEAALALVQRITEARRRALDASFLSARDLLARGSSSRGDWRARIERLADGAATFRTAAVPPEALWNVLSDPAETAEVRAAAALALRRQLDADGRARVRLAAETSAAPPLRRVLSAVTDHDERELDEALDDLSPAPRAART